MPSTKNKKSTVACKHSECQLPLNNNRYIIQFGYMFIAIVYLSKDNSQFTFVAILLFTIPIMIDLWYADIKEDAIKAFKWFFIIYNFAIFLFCTAGMINMIVDKGDKFVILDAAVFISSDIELSKLFLSRAIMLDLMVPAVFMRGMPTQKAMEVIGAFEKGA